MQEFPSLAALRSAGGTGVVAAGDRGIRFTYEAGSLTRIECPGGYSERWQGGRRIERRYLSEDGREVVEGDPLQAMRQDILVRMMECADD